MVEGIWKKREQALENAFFQKRNEELLQQLRRNLDKDQRKAKLCKASGITDDQVLEALLAVNIDAEALAAIVLVPLVVVAWVDGSVAPAERDAILKAAENEGIDSGDVSHQLLASWLEEPPGEELSVAWKEFVKLLVEQFPADSLELFRDDVIGRARKVARAAGGLLGVGGQSASESAAIKDLEAAFSP